jgi:hypothetical protein
MPGQTAISATPALLIHGRMGCITRYWRDLRRGLLSGRKASRRPCARVEVSFAKGTHCSRSLANLAQKRALNVASISLLPPKDVWGR